VTHWELQASFNGRDGKPVASLLACQLETGRTHQIRVHLSHIGHPLLGDASMARTSRPRPASSDPRARRRWPPSTGRPYMLTCWLWNTPNRGTFALGSGFAGGFASPESALEAAL
jgi:Pseudouridylate synthases, 23S RNA-specific